MVCAPALDFDSTVGVEATAISVTMVVVCRLRAGRERQRRDDESCLWTQPRGVTNVAIRRLSTLGHGAIGGMVQTGLLKYYNSPTNELLDFRSGVKSDGIQAPVALLRDSSWFNKEKDALTHCARMWLWRTPPLLG